MQIRYVTSGKLTTALRSKWHERYRLPMYLSGWGVEVKTRIWIDESGRSRKETLNLEIARANRYLSYMLNKLAMLKRKENKKEYYELMNVFMSTSRAFAALVLNESEPQWYWRYSKDGVVKAIAGMRKFLASKNVKGLTINRHYLRKPNGKWRPIGAPALKTKLIHKALDILIRETFEDRMPKWQHGFMPKKSCATASKELIMSIRANPKKIIVHEFDLSSCFNRVNVRNLFNKGIVAGDEYWKVVAHWLHALLTGNPPKAQEFKDEDKEVVKYRNGQRLCYMLYGLPQGSPISPIFANLSIASSKLSELAKKGKLIMYADDGVFLSEEKTQLKEYIETEIRDNSIQWLMDRTGRVKAQSRSNPKDWGVYLSEGKPYGPTERFKFLGIEYSLHGNYKLAWRNLPDGTQVKLNLLESSEEEVDQFVGLASYNKTQGKAEMKHWSWDIKNDSYLGETWMPYNSALGPTIGQVMVWVLNKILYYSPKIQTWLNAKMMRNPFGASTFSTIRLLEDLSRLRRPDVVQFRAFPRRGFLTPHMFFPAWPTLSGPNDGLAVKWFMRGDYVTAQPSAQQMRPGIPNPIRRGGHMIPRIP